jgi:cytochrome b subunit of formate dehydrogenase
MIRDVFCAVFLLLVALFIAGLVINVPKILSGENMLTDLLATVIVEASLGVFAYFTYVFFIKEYVDKQLRR